MTRQGGQLKPQFCRRMIEIRRFVRCLLSVLQNEIQNSGRVEMSRVKRRAGAFRQNKLVRRDEVVDAAG